MKPCNLFKVKLKVKLLQPHPSNNRQYSGVWQQILHKRGAWARLSLRSLKQVAGSNMDPNLGPDRHQGRPPRMQTETHSNSALLPHSDCIPRRISCKQIDGPTLQAVELPEG